MEFNLSNILTETGLSLPEAMDKMQKAVSFVPKVKSYMPMIKKLDSMFNVKPGQKLLYSIMPVIPTYTGNETPEEKAKLDSLCELKVSVLVIEKNAAGETVIADEKISFKVFEEVEKITSLFPKR